MEKKENSHPPVIVSAGAAGATQKISFICDEHPRPLETKGTVRYEKLIISCVPVIILLCNRRATHCARPLASERRNKMCPL